MRVAGKQAHLGVTRGASGEEQSDPAGKSLVKRRQESDTFSSRALAARFHTHGYTARAFACAPT